VPTSLRRVPVRRDLLGTTMRGGGLTQVTHAGHPMYYFVGDQHAGEVLCKSVQEFGGTW
jgi:hypothetical protein